MTILGPSGCGKSTLLRIIAGLEDQTSGHVTIAGKNVDVTPPAKRGIAMVFQSYALYPHLTVKGNMGLALKQEGVEKSEIERRIAAAAKMLHLDTLLDRRPSELSGGQRQRVAIARALANSPALLIADEPTGQLDAETGHAVMELLRAVVHSENVTALVATHDATLLDLADRVLELSDGEIIEH